MARAKSHDGLEIEQDPRFEEIVCSIQRIGWLLLFLTIVLALLGMFGSGPLSNMRSTDASGSLRIEYERFLRLDAATRLRVEISPGVTQAKTRIWLSNRMLARVQMERIEPPPEAIELDADGRTHIFLTGNSGPVHLDFHYKPDEMGPLPAQIRLNDERPLSFGHFVYP